MQLCYAPPKPKWAGRIYGKELKLRWQHSQSEAEYGMDRVVQGRVMDATRTGFHLQSVYIYTIFEK